MWGPRIRIKRRDFPPLVNLIDYPRDFLPLLNEDLSLKIFSYLDGPADVVRASSVSRSWRAFVIENELSKSACIRRVLLEAPCIIKAIEDDNIIEPLEVKTNGSMEMEKLKRNHRVYTFLALGASHWSSAGESNPDVSETLTYKLVPELRLVTKIQASAKAVRFRMGHFREPERETDLVNDYDAHPRSIEDHVVWTYTSEKFPLLQVTCSQMFRLPEPVFAIGGGLLQIELLDRVPGSHLRVSQVEVLGRPLIGDYILETIGRSGKYALKYSPVGAPRRHYYDCGDCGDCMYCNI